MLLWTGRSRGRGVSKLVTSDWDVVEGNWGWQKVQRQIPGPAVGLPCASRNLG